MTVISGSVVGGRPDYSKLNVFILGKMISSWDSTGRVLTDGSHLLISFPPQIFAEGDQAGGHHQDRPRLRLGQHQDHPHAGTASGHDVRWALFFHKSQPTLMISLYFNFAIKILPTLMNNK